MAVAVAAFDRWGEACEGARAGSARHRATRLHTMVGRDPTATAAGGGGGVSAVAGTVPRGRPGLTGGYRPTVTSADS